VGSDFYVDQGFIDTLNWNIQGVEGHVWNKFLQDKGWFQWINGHGSFDVRREIGGRPTHAETELGIDFITRPKWRFSIGGSRGYERYGEQEFANRGLEFQIESNVGGMTGVSSSYTTGTLYDLPLRFFHLGFLILPIRRASVFPYFQGFRWGENSWEWLSNARISYQVTEKAFVRIFLRAESEYRTPTDRLFAVEEIGDLDGNLLFGYEFSPGTILYLVYNQQQTFTTEETDYVFVAKFSYSLQF